MRRQRHRKMTKTEERREKVFGLFLLIAGGFSLIYLVYVPHILMSELPNCLCSKEKRFIFSEKQILKMEKTGITKAMLDKKCEELTTELDCMGVRQCTSMKI